VPAHGSKKAPLRRLAVEPIPIYVDGHAQCVAWWWRGVKTEGKKITALAGFAKGKEPSS
jgi:hypothetical protein